MKREYYNNKSFFNLLDQYGSVDKIPNIEDHEIGAKTEDDLADIPVNNDFAEYL